MKTRELLGFFPLLLSALMAGGSGATMAEATESTRVMHSHGSFHRKGKLKGWMRERKRCSFNKNR
jgi:hypothetical protein